MVRNPEEDLGRILEIAQVFSRLEPMLVGTLTEKRNRKRRKDGSEYVSAPYFTFQYKDPQGRRSWKRIPRRLSGRVRKLIEAGERYRKLEREFRGLSSETGLREAAKKNG